jgi:acetyl-CoA carboxylase, biotin carboxylase subunit
MRLPGPPQASKSYLNRDAAFDLEKTIGFPVIIKAAAGGGRGIRIARSAGEFHDLMP